MRVPDQFVQNGQIVLNVAPTAVRELVMANEAITFSARFAGQPMQVVVPNEALIALYARENGVGMVFGHEPVMPEYAELSPESPEENPEESEQRPTLETVEGNGEAPDDEGKGKGEKGARKDRPSLRVIK